jgi:hypothetical protein
MSITGHSEDPIGHKCLCYDEKSSAFSAGVSVSVGPSAAVRTVLTTIVVVTFRLLLRDRPPSVRSPPLAEHSRITHRTAHRTVMLVTGSDHLLITGQARALIASARRSP